MRVSAGQNSPDFNYRAIHAKVFLDGVELRGCITADDETGECHCYAQNEDGSFIESDGEAMTKTMHGKVEIKLPTDEEIEARQKEYRE